MKFTYKCFHKDTARQYFEVNVIAAHMRSTYTFDTMKEVRAFQAGFTTSKMVANSAIQAFPDLTEESAKPV